MSTFAKVEDGTIIETLQLALDALNASKPTHEMYPEPKERHAKAIEKISTLLKELELK